MYSVWHKISIYWAAMTAILDQGTDWGAIYYYWSEWQIYKDLDPDEREERAANPYYFFLFGITIIAVQKVVSSATIYFFNRDCKSALLQFFDLLIMKAVYINYKLDLDEPCNAQRYIELLVKYKCFIITYDTVYTNIYA